MTDTPLRPYPDNFKEYLARLKDRYNRDPEMLDVLRLIDLMQEWVEQRFEQLR